MRILIADGLRRIRASGYGALSRNLTFALADLGMAVLLPEAPWPRDRDWEPIESGARERLEALPRGRASDADLVLQIGSPGSCREFEQPTLIYTQNALGDLRDDWIELLARADGCIVPGEFDRRVFARHFDRVSVAPQSSNADVFRPRPGERDDDREAGFRFLFVGSYSFRKGVDLLLEAFLTEFGPSEDVELVLHCPGIGRGDEFNHLLGMIQRLNPLAKVRLIGRLQSPEWMARAYTRAHCTITLTRGEGWCMPLTESLLCETPVIAPSSTAMAEYLDDEIADLLPVREREIASIEDAFGRGFARTYGKPGNVLYEPDVDAAREAMRSAVRDPVTARAKAVAGAERIREEVTWEAAAKAVAAACADLLRAATVVGAEE